MDRVVSVNLKNQHHGTKLYETFDGHHYILHQYLMSTTIEWTEATWNPVTGCSKISPGCKNCYAERMSYRIRAMGLHKYRNGFDVTLHPSTLQDPMKWRKPRMVFVNSMSDLFHEDVDDAFIWQVFDTMNEANHHTYQILTKRPERVLALDPYLLWSSNIWMGVSIENATYSHRIDTLLETTACTKFLSCEPLLGSVVPLDLDGIDWVIVGGESGPGARGIDKQWVREIRDQCIQTDMPFFFKQWGGTMKKRNGRILDGRTWDEFPSKPTKQSAYVPLPRS